MAKRQQRKESFMQPTDDHTKNNIRRGIRPNRGFKIAESV